jgi:transposase-like protein
MYSRSQQVLDLMASGATQADACRKFGINIQTFLYWIRKDKGTF